MRMKCYFTEIALEKDCQIGKTDTDLCSGRGESLCILSHLQISCSEDSYLMYKTEIFEHLRSLTSILNRMWDFCSDT